MYRVDVRSLTGYDKICDRAVKHYLLYDGLIDILPIWRYPILTFICEAMVPRGKNIPTTTISWCFPCRGSCHCQSTNPRVRLKKAKLPSFPVVATMDILQTDKINSWWQMCPKLLRLRWSGYLA